MKYLKKYEQVWGISFQQWLEKNPQDLNIKKIDCSRCNLTDLKGIEKFTNLEYLYCYRNRITDLHLKHNLELLELSCHNNQLSQLILKKNTKLKSLFCAYNQLNQLDLESNLEIVNIYCHNNQLTQINLNKNFKLTELYCIGNQLTELNLESNPNLTNLYCEDNPLPYQDMAGYQKWFKKTYPDRMEAKKFGF